MGEWRIGCGYYVFLSSLWCLVVIARSEPGLSVLKD